MSEAPELPQEPKLENLKPELEKQAKEIGKLTQILFFVVIVLLIGMGAMFVTVGTLVWNAHLFGQSTYQELVEELRENNDKIDILSQEIFELESEQIIIDP